LSAAFDKQPKEKQDLDWDAALRNETDVCDGLESDVDTVLDSLHLKKAAAPEIIYEHYEGFFEDPPNGFFNEFPVTSGANLENANETNVNENKEGWEARSQTAQDEDEPTMKEQLDNLLNPIEPLFKGTAKEDDEAIRGESHQRRW
jgi:hypothetical protein